MKQSVVWLQISYAGSATDIPLNNFQAQYNESLLTMYFGYHPDAFWEVEEIHFHVEKLKSDKDVTSDSSSNPVASVNFHEKKAEGLEEIKEDEAFKSAVAT